jgi:tetratricopeptide (TPR) repeat protein
MADQDLIGLAEQLLQQGRISRARGPLDVLAEREGQDARFLQRLGDLERRAGDRSNARIAYRRSAEAYSRQGLAHKAVAVLGQVVHLSPDSVEARLDLARCYESIGRNPEAAAQYQAAVQLLEMEGDPLRAAPLVLKVNELRPQLRASSVPPPPPQTGPAAIAGSLSGSETAPMPVAPARPLGSALGQIAIIAGSPLLEPLYDRPALPPVMGLSSPVAPATPAYRPAQLDSEELKPLELDLSLSLSINLSPEDHRALEAAGSLARPQAEPASEPESTYEWRPEPDLADPLAALDIALATDAASAFDPLHASTTVSISAVDPSIVLDPEVQAIYERPTLSQTRVIEEDTGRIRGDTTLPVQVMSGLADDPTLSHDGSAAANEVGHDTIAMSALYPADEADPVTLRPDSDLPSYAELADRTSRDLGSAETLLDLQQVQAGGGLISRTSRKVANMVTNIVVDPRDKRRRYSNAG